MPVLPAPAPVLTLKVRGHISESQDLTLRARETKSEYSEFQPSVGNKVGLVMTEGQLRCRFSLCLPCLQPAGSRGLRLGDSGDKRAHHT